MSKEKKEELEDKFEELFEDLRCSLIDYYARADSKKKKVKAMQWYRDSKKKIHTKIEQELDKAMEEVIEEIKIIASEPYLPEYMNKEDLVEIIVSKLRLKE